MASSYTDIGTELMTTGENAGNWGTKTNTNLQILEEALRGYVSQSIAGGAQTTALTYTDGTVGDAARNMVIALTGTITGNQTITVPAVEKMWIIDNQTTGAFTVNIKVSGQTGVTWGASDKGTKILYGNGTDVVDTDIGGVGAYDLNGATLTLDADGDTDITADSDDQIDIRIAGADDFQFTANTFTAQAGSTIAAQALTATTVTASGIIKTDDTTAATSTTDGSLQTDGGLSVAADAIIGDDLKLLSDSAVLSFGADSDTTLTHTDGTGLTLNGANKLLFRDTGLTIGSNADGDLDIVSDGTAVDSINIESGGGITLDAGTAGSGVIYEDDGTEMLRIYNSSSDVYIESKVSDKDILIRGNDGGSATTALTFDMSAAGKATFNNEIVSGAVITSGAGLVIANAGNIGSASDTDAIAISSGGVVTFSQAPVFPDGSIAIADIDLDGGTDVGAAIADADLFLIDDGAGGTMRKATASRIKSYMGAEGGAFSLANLDIDGATDIGAAIVDADLFIIDDGAGGTNRKVTASRLKTYAQTGVSSAADDITEGDAAVTLSTSSGNITIDATANDTDIIFKGTDNSSDITAATFDMSDGGALLLAGGVIDLKNRGSVSNIKFYCESSNAHYAQLQSAAHSAYSGNITLTLPASTDTLVGKATTDTLTNKTLTTPVIAEIDSGADITLDATADVVIDAAGGNVEFKDAGTLQLTLDMDGTAGAQVISLAVDSDDLIFKQYDGTTVLTLDDDTTVKVATDLTVGDDLTLLSDSAVLGFGADTDTTLTHTDGTGLTLNSTNKLCFNDASQFIQGASATVLDIAATDEIELTATLIDVVGNFTNSGTIASTGVITANAGVAIDNITIDGTEIDLSSGDLTLDVAGDIILDAGGSDWSFQTGGTEVLKITNSSSDVIIKPIVDAKDIIFQQRDGTEVARIEDNATFNVSSAGKFAYAGTAVTSTAAELNIVDGGTSATSTTVADADRVVLNDNGTMVQVAMTDIKTYIGGGTSWQAVKTGDFTAAAGQGVFVNTTSAAITITLPAGTIGDEVSIIDYAGTFDSNNCTVAANGSEKIHASTDDLTVATERAGFTLVFTDSTQGWLLKDK